MSVLTQLPGSIEGIPVLDATDVDRNRRLTDIVAARRSLHRHPEEGWCEFQTTYRLVECLRKMGLKVRAGRAIVAPEAVMGRDEARVSAALRSAREAGVPEKFLDELGGFTGCLAEIDTGRAGPVTAFRCDIDGLTVTESTDPEHRPNRLGFASCRKGFMHACGHDAHMAVMLGVARWVKDHENELVGRILFLFQPAEEGVKGAGAVAASGVLDEVDHLVGAHIGIHCREGELGLFRRGLLATTKFDVTFTGLAAHAGAFPEKGKSALSAACAAVMMLEGISRHSEGETRIAVGTLHAGEGRNITPERAEMQLEVRGSTAETNDFMAERVERILKGAAESYDVSVSIRRVGEATTLSVCEPLLAACRRAGERVPGVRVLDIEKPAGSEDFTLLMRRVIEKGGNAAYVLYGANHPGHHRPDFDFDEEKTLPAAYDFLREIALELNGKSDVL